jgi:hypothetical protein
MNAISNTSDGSGSNTTSVSGGIDYEQVVGDPPTAGAYFARKAHADQVPGTTNATDGVIHQTSTICPTAHLRPYPCCTCGSPR